MKKSIIIAVTFFIVCVQSTYPQISTNELPISVQRGLGVFTKDKTKGIVDLPVPDIKKVLQEDSLNQERNPNGLKRTAVSIPIIVDSNNDGVWTTLDSGGRLWQMEIHVTTSKPQGPVSIEKGKVTNKCNGTVTIKNNFDVKIGAELEIKN